MSKKILVIDFNGTTPVYTYYFAKNLKSENTMVDILGHQNREELNYFDEKLNYLEINLKNKGINYFFYWIYLFFLAKKYDVLIIEWLPFLKFSSIEIIFVKILKKLNKNLLYTVHNFFPHDNRDEKIIKRYKKLYKIIPELLVHTNETKEKLREIGIENKIKIINHGYFYYDLKIDEEKDLKMLSMIGTISKYKGIEDAIKMMKILKDHGFYLYIAGKGESDYIQSIKDMIKKEKLEKFIVLKNEYLSVLEVIRLTKKSAVTIMPYKNIEQSGVALTSLGLNTPIVAYNVGGLKDIVSDSFNGYLVEKNNYEEMAFKILELLLNYSKLILNIEKIDKIKSWQENLEIIIQIKEEK